MNSVKQVLVSGLALLQLISGAYTSNFLTSQLSQVNGSITACAGEEISLTCGHNNTVPITTTWKISSPVNCSTEITHNPPTPDAPPCGPFSFQDITVAEMGAVQLNSTAVATASRDISGSIIECIAGFIPSPSVGNISLCVIDELPAPVNLQCMKVPRGLSVSWDVVTDGNSSCARSSIVYEITVANRTIASVNDTQIEITGSLLEPNQNYTIYVRARLVQGTCDTREAAIVCRTSDDLSLPPGTVPVTTDDEETNTIDPETKNKSSVSAAAVAVPIVLILVAAVVIIVILIIFGYRRYYGELPCNLNRVLKDKNSHVYELTHTPAPGGDLYTDISKAPSKSKHHEAQQDNTHNGFSDESKDPDVKTDIAPREDDIPPPKPKRMSKAESKAESETKSETKDKEKASKPPLSDPGYEDLDNFQSS